MIRNEIFKPGRSENGGFSLIEIMVVVGILTYYKHNDFCQLSRVSQKLSLKNQRRGRFDCPASAILRFGNQEVCSWQR